MSTLHVINGEGTGHSFRRAGIPGEIMVWNEALSWGPVSTPFGTDEFWELRRDFLNKHPVMDRQPKGQDPYKLLVLSEFSKLENTSDYREICLWFEHDLFCQVNLLGLLSWLATRRPRPQVWLICIDRFPGIPDFRGLGQLQPADFPALLPSKALLGSRDLDFARTAWDSYCHHPQTLLEMDTLPGAFPFVQAAFKLHAARFPSSFNGLSLPQQMALEILSDRQPLTQDHWVRALLEAPVHFGFGDLQYLEILHSLGKLTEETSGGFVINENGARVLGGQQDFLELHAETHYLGAILNHSFRWNGQKLMVQPH